MRKLFATDKAIKAYGDELRWIACEYDAMYFCRKHEGAMYESNDMTDVIISTAEDDEDEPLNEVESAYTD